MKCTSKLLAVGNAVGENDVRDGLAVQLATAAGLRMISEYEWVLDGNTPVQEPADGTLAMFDAINQEPRGLTKAESEAISFALPHAVDTLIKAGRRIQGGGSTSIAVVALTLGEASSGARLKDIRLDTRAQYCVAGPERAKFDQFDQRLDVIPPVDYVEGVTGDTAKAKRVGGSSLRRIKLDFLTREMNWYGDGVKKIVPINYHQLTKEDKPSAKVRLVCKVKVRTQTHNRMVVAVAALEGSVGLYEPKSVGGVHILLVPTVTTVRGSKIVVPVLTLVGKTTKLPSREVLGT
ncbi:unnamed protein product [Phytophthora fragariaefolia]|uniref:Unnamed protein product n=1 Tax=Phytophthora fragariaefolia TaxID=1490495 RepID=A0A9W6U061_9STRA|nr:unnamed protein product [Phytophthora fragariaefolia]